MSSLTARSVARVLQDSPEAAMLVARWEASQRAAHVIAPLCSSLAAGFDPAGNCVVQDRVLWLTASSAAQSAKLRQAAPRLLSALGADGIAVYELKTRIQPGGSSYPRGGTHAVSSDDRWLRPGKLASSTMSELALTIAESPLKTAVERLARTLRKRAGNQA